MHYFTKYLGFKTYAHIVHPQFKTLCAAIKNNEPDQIHAILQQFALISFHTYDLKMLNIVGTADMQAYMHDYWKFFAHVIHPQIIYEFLAAGFPVIELALTFKYAGNHNGLKVLFELLPGLSEEEQKRLESLNTDLDRCVLSLGIPKIPVRFNGQTFCLTQLINAVETTHLINLGYSNQNAIQNQEKIEIDLQYLHHAKQKLHALDNPESAITGIKTNFLDALIAEQKKQHAELELCLLLANASKNMALGLPNAVKFMSGRLLLLFCAEIAALNVMIFASLKYTSYINSAAIEWQPVYDFNYAMRYFALLATAGVLAINSWVSIGGLIIRQSETAKLIKQTPGLARLFKDYIDLHESIVKLETCFNNLQNNMFTSADRDFDFEQAQKTLPARITQRFKQEYTEKTAPGLFFWTQAFAEERSEKTADIKYNNTPAYTIKF